MRASTELLENEAARRELLVQRLKAAQGHVSRELVSDLAATSEGRALLEDHLARLREKKDEGGALVALAALRLLDAMAGGGKSTRASKGVPSELASAFESGSLVEPRRSVAWKALRQRADAFARTRSRAFLDGLERLERKDTSAGVETLVAEERFERDVPKVGRNDPCPCGSGKKFKKCCEKGAAEGPPPLGALLKRVRWTEEIYAISPEQQLELAGEPAFREHLDLLAQPERPRRPPRDDPYLVLAVLARVFQSRSSPGWARDQAWTLVEGASHPAVDRGSLAAWLVETRGDTASPAEVEALVRRVGAALARGPITIEGAVAASLALSDAGSHALALEIASRPEGGERDARLSLVRAIAAHGAGDFERARAELERLGGELAGPDGSVLEAAVFEARSALLDPPESPAPAEEDDEAEPEPAAPVRPLAELSAEIASTRKAPVAEVEPPRAPEPARAPEPPPEPGRPASPPRKAPLLDAALPEEISRLAAAREAEERALEAELSRSRKEHEDARASVRALERELEQARERADRTKRALARREQDLAALKNALGAGLPAVVRELEAARAFLAERSREHWPRAEEVVVPIVAALLPDEVLLVAPLSARDYFSGALTPDLSRLAHALVATVANVARQSDQPEESVTPETALGFLAVRGDAPLAGFRERGELWALAIDDAWARMAIAGSTRLSPSLVVLPKDAALALVDLAETVVLAPPAVADESDAGDGPLTIELAARKLGRSSFELARCLGSRSLWDNTGLVLPGVLATIRALDGERGPSAGSGSSPEAREALDAHLEADPQLPRRALRTVLRRLIRLGKIGASHTRVDNALRGTPPHLRGTIKEAVDALIVAGVFRPKPTHNGLHISLEPQRIPEVDDFIRSGETPWPRVAAILKPS